MIPFTFTNESITVIVEGKPHTVQKGTPQYTGLRDCILREAWDEVGKHTTAAGALQQWLGDKFVVTGDKITYDGVELPESLRSRIWAMLAGGESPGPLFAFYERLHRNPSFRSRTQLHSFMQHAGIPIEADGTFLAYKGVKHDYTDGYTGKVDNSVGTKHEMPRHLISDDPNTACHYGYHVGALGYAGTFSERTVICRVDPEHVVCVPYDYNSKKMRVCAYEVIANHGGDVTDSRGNEMPSTTIAPEALSEIDDDEDWEGDVDVDEVDDDEGTPAAKRVVIARHTGPKASSFNRKNPKQLLEQSIEDLRKYASAHLKIMGAYKLPGGKSALVSKILKVRRRRR